VPLTKREQYRRATLLCCHFVRNLAYERAGKQSMNELKESGDFWTIVNNNFLNSCVLEWCKLFVDTKNRQPSEHRWDNIVADKVRFEAELYQRINQTRFQRLIDEMRTTRNKFIAHLDDQNTEYMPHMDIAKTAVQFYHGYIIDEANPGELVGLPTDLNDYIRPVIRRRGRYTNAPPSQRAAKSMTLLSREIVARRLLMR
jgi:hypothetical protein